MAFVGAVHPPPARRNVYKNPGFFLLPTPIVCLGEELPQDPKKKKKKWERFSI